MERPWQIMIGAQLMGHMARDPSPPSFTVGACLSRSSQGQLLPVCCPSVALPPHLYPESDAALRDRLDAIYSAGQRDQDAAVVDLFQERSRSQRHARTRGTPPALGR
jgi:hypothetical protein